MMILRNCFEFYELRFLFISFMLFFVLFRVFVQTQCIASVP